MTGETLTDKQMAFVTAYRKLVRGLAVQAARDAGLGTSRNQRSGTAERATRAESIKAQIIMLDLTMPNGKAMKDCTGAEMAKFGNRYQKIAERVGKAKLVGTVLSEDQVKAIMK